ncbi:uncharacterized protein LOC135839402 isoform X2 [Planococcus citri]
MCDENCTLYGDCCEDSQHINHNKTYKLEYFYCPPAERVYMKTTCPPNYPNQSVKSKCESSMKSLQNENKKLYIPVTNVQKNITYGNEYCAVCNNEFVYIAWNLTTHCSPITNNDQIPSTEKTQQFVSSTEKMSASTPDSQFIDYHKMNLEEAKKRVRFNSTSKTFFSEYNGTKYDCWYKRLKPAELEPHFRDCVSTISNCSLKNSTFVNLCDSSHTSIVYDEFKDEAYRNKYCAYCNNITSNLRGCFDPGTRITGSSIFTTFDKGQGQKPPCNNADAKVKNKFC